MAARRRKPPLQRKLNTTTYTKTLPVVAPASTWELLGKLLVVVNYELVQRGESQLNLSKLLGTIATHYVATLGQDTDAEFQRIRHELSVKGLPSFFSPDQLDAIEAASATEVSNALRISWNRGSGTARKKDRAALRRAARRPESPTTASAAASRELRARRSGASTGNGKWGKRQLDLFPGGAGAIGPRSDRLQPPASKSAQAAKAPVTGRGKAKPPQKG